MLKSKTDCSNRKADADNPNPGECIANTATQAVHTEMLVLTPRKQKCMVGSKHVAQIDMLVLTSGGDVFLEAFNMDALLEVLPDLQPGGSRVQQVCDDLLVDLQEAASTYEPHLPPLTLSHATPPVSNASCGIMQDSMLGFFTA